MPIDAKKNEITLILALSRIILDRDPEFTPATDEELASMTAMELQKLHRQYHELAYAPPPRR
jgi:hypothetical protein